MLLLQIVRWVVRDLEKGKARTDCSGREAVPVDLKVLGVLRILGRATCFDGITELSGIAVTTMCTFFHKFTAWFRSDIYPIFVHMPKDRDELAELVAPYALLGIPGAFFSMDVVHASWPMCPASLSNLATGKKGSCGRGGALRSEAARSCHSL